MPRRGDRRTTRRVAAMVAAASALVTAVQVAVADPAAASCYRYGSDCIEEVIVTPPPDPGGGGSSDPRDYPSGGGGAGGGGGSANTTCYEYLDVCVENVTVSATRPNPFGIGETPYGTSFLGEVYIWIFGVEGYAAPKPDLVESYAVAVELLEDPACNAVVTGSNPPPLGAGYQDARHVARYTVFVDLNDPALFFMGEDAYGMSILAPAFATAESEGGGAGQTITIHEAFHTLYDPGIFGRDLLRPPTQTEQQALILLHEIGHLTGATPRHFGDVPEVNGRITEACFKTLGL